jgi:hypothetical protein
MKRLLGLDRTFLWALRGVLRVFVRANVVPEDALVRLHGRTRPLLYVLGSAAFPTCWRSSRPA